MSPAVINISGLCFEYPNGVQALQGVNYQQFAGESVALFGPNGSGKTTFAMHLTGALLDQGRTAGSVEICGIPVIPARLAEVRRRVGFLFQDPNDQLFMPTVEEDVAFGLLNEGLSFPDASARVRPVLEQLGLVSLARRAPHQLSAGEKQRVALAGLLVMEPDILVLDEPSTALDPPSVRRLLELLAPLKQAKVLITHDTRLAQRACHRAVFFQDGRIRAEGSVDQLAVEFQWDLGGLD